MIIRNNSRATINLGTVAGASDIFHRQQVKLITTKKISGSHKIKYWIDLFDSLAQYDETNEAKLKINSVLARIFGSIAFFGMLIFYSLGWYWILIGFFVVLVIIFHFIDKGKNKADTNIENHFRLYALPLFYVFQNEASPDTHLKIDADFNKPEQKAYLIKTIPNIVDTYPQINRDFYKINWLNAKLTFADKTQVEITISDLIRVQKVTKRNPRGKIKTKTKRKIKQTIAVKVFFDKTKYKPATETSTTPNLLEQTDGYSIKIKSYNAIKTTNTNINYDEYTDINPLLAAIAQAYAAVVPI
jgi:hypothetical protein